MARLDDLQALTSTGTPEQKIDAHLELALIISSGSGCEPDLLQALLHTIEAAKLGSAAGVLSGVKILSDATKTTSAFELKNEYAGQIFAIFPLQDMEEMRCDEALAIAGTAFEDMQVASAEAARASNDKRYVNLALDYLAMAAKAYRAAGRIAADPSAKVGREVREHLADRTPAVEAKLSRLAAHIIEHGAMEIRLAENSQTRGETDEADGHAQAAFADFNRVLAWYDDCCESPPRDAAKAELDRLFKIFPSAGPDPTRSNPPRIGSNPSSDLG